MTPCLSQQPLTRGQGALPRNCPGWSGALQREMGGGREWGAGRGMGDLCGPPALGSSLILSVDMWSAESTGP